MIKPTVGRVVLYRPGAGEDSYCVRADDQPWAAMITAVWSDTEVNLVVFDAIGTSRGRIRVPLVQDGATPEPDAPYCEWMPYQLGQAAKTEHAESVAKMLAEQQPRTA